MTPVVTVLGGGLAGCEAALQLLSRGYGVRMYEMRPGKSTGAHRTDALAELVCSNSLKSEVAETASGTLKEELDALGCRLLPIARECRVPSGGALAVDRERFSSAVSAALFAYPAFTLVREEATDIPPAPAVIATGPLTSDALAEKLARLTGAENLHFYDAIAPIVELSAVDRERAYFGGRYGRGEDYLNLPMEREEYRAFREALVSAETVVLRDFEKKELFEGCMPIEEIAKRGEDAMRFGPLRPVGLRDPATGKGAYAVVQLRRESMAGEGWNMVGFQTNLTYGAQKRVFGMIPALKNAEFLRYGVMHRNTYLNSAGSIKETFRFAGDDALYIAGQLTGVEGYVESVMSGLIAAVSLARELAGKEAAVPPSTTVTGALCRYVAGAETGFQPMNANFGLLPTAPDVGKKERKKFYHDRAVRDIMKFVSDTSYRDVAYCEGAPNSTAGRAE